MPRRLGPRHPPMVFQINTTTHPATNNRGRGIETTMPPPPPPPPLLSRTIPNRPLRNSIEPLGTACGGGKTAKADCGGVCLSHTSTSPGDVGQIPREESPGYWKAGVAGERDRCNQAPVSVDSWAASWATSISHAVKPVCYYFLYPFLPFRVDTPPCAMTLRGHAIICF